MSNDDPKTRTVTKPLAKVVAPPADPDATVIRVPGAPPPAAAPAPAPGPDNGNSLPMGTFLAEFELTEALGEGGFGIVYLARDHSLQRRVALKEYMPSSLASRIGGGDGTQVVVKSERYRETFDAGLKSFVNEARLLAQFDHPSLVKVYRFWEANGTAYMVMPFYEGTTLKQQLKAMGAPPNEAWLMELLEPLTEALEVIHAEQCYHRDIAPDNVILLKGSNRPLLLDFGAARRVIGDMTQALTVILKPGYAPVEQYAEVPGMKQGPWTDVYALAAVVYYAIMGKTPPTSVGRLMNDSFVPLSQAAAGRYSPGFLAVIDKALAVRPEQRTASIGELRQALGLTARSADRPAKPAKSSSAGASARTTVEAPASRSKAPLLIGGGVLALAVAGAGIYAVMGGSKPAPAPVVGAAAPAPSPAVSPAASAVAPVAVAPSPAPAPAPVAPVASFDPAHEIERIVQGQTAGFEVSAATTRPTFRIGKSSLGFKVTSSREGHVYVLLYGTDGAFTQVFPAAGDRKNQIHAGQTLTLPRSPLQLDVAGPAGLDRWVAIVSKYPRDFQAAGMREESGFGQFQKDRLDEIARGHAGPGSAFAGQPVCGAATPCADEYGAAAFTSEEVQ